MPAARQHKAVAFVTVALLSALAVAGSAGGVELPRKRDREAPTAPANVRVAAAAPASVSLEWDAATDDVEVSFYYVYVDAQRARVSGTKYTASNLACGQSVGVWVVAYDSSLNRSPSAAATVSTAACPDSQPPSPPSGFRQAATAQDAVVLAWAPSLDDVGVVGYGIYRDQLPVKSASESSADLSGLACASTYEYQVDSVDAAGNRSERRSAWVQTAECATASPIAAGDWTFCANEYEKCTFEGTKEVRYGLDGTFTAPRLFTNGVACTNGVFGDPLRGALKRCEHRDLGGTPPPPPSPPPSGDWTFCANEYEQCRFEGTKEVRYGLDGTFTAPRMFTDGVSCTNGVFGDPLRGALKRCEHRDVGGAPPPPDTPPSDKTPPSQPASIAAGNVTRTSVSLRWEPSSDNVGIAAYDVFRNGTKMASLSATSSDQGGLACGTLYWFGVEAVDGAGNRSARTRTHATTSACATPPSGWTFCANEYERCTFSGTKEVRYGANGTFTAPRVFSNGVSCTNAIFGDPLPGALKRCEYRDLGGGTPPPPSDNPPPDRAPPSQPANLAVASVTKTSVSLTWSASTDNVAVTGYGVYVNGTNALSANQPGATVSNLACGTAFTFAVDAVDQAGNRSAKAQLTAATAPCGAADTQAPTVPTNVQASSRNATSIALTWTASTDNVSVTGYGLYRGGTLVDTATTATGIFSGLTCNTNYTLAVDAKDGAGNRSGKATVMVATTGCADTTAPSAPAGLAASNVTRSSLTLTWNASTDNVGVVSYDVFRTGTKMENTSSRSSSQTGLACATSYWFGVEALDAAGNRSARTNVNAVTSACAAPPPPPSPPSGGARIGAWRIATSSVDTVGDASRWRYIVANPNEYTRIPGWKAANPGIKALAYKDMSSTRSYTSAPFPPAGMDYAWVNANHPDWFLLHSNGNRIEWGGYGGHWQMDIGNVAYQNQWAANVIADLQANGWSGIMVDNVQMEPSGVYYSGRPPKYPTQASYQAATRSFLANVGPKVMAAGFSVYLNIQAHGNIGLSGPTLWNDWCQFASGAVREFWTKWGYGTDMQHGGSTWTNQQSIFTTLQNAGKSLLALTYAPKTDTRSIRYAWASFLLGWNGSNSSAFMFEPMPEAQDPWSPDWTTDIGTPTAPATQVGTGWKRTYSGGTVYVNPSESASVTIDSRSLAPMSGLVVPTA